MKSAAALVTFSLLVTATGRAWASPPSPEKAFLALPPAKQEADAPRILQKRVTGDDIFAMGGIGITGARPLRYLAYQALLRRPDAAARFTDLLRSPDAQTQLYALNGLAVRAPGTFRQVAPRFTRRTDPIKMAQGCMMSTQPLGRLVRDLQAAQATTTQ